MTVIVDTYEVTNNPKTQEQLDKLKIDYQIVSLTKGGDYLIEGEVEKVVIERKEISDLFNSNHEGRLAKQMNKLMTEYVGYKKILLIEGNINTVIARRQKRTGSGSGDIIDYAGSSRNDYARYSAEFVGIVNSIITTSDINVIQVGSKWQSITLLKNLDQWANGKRRGRRSSVAKKVNRLEKREVEDLWLSLYGVGWKKVNEITSAYPSVMDFAKAIIDGKDADIKAKLGENLGKHIIEVFTYRVQESDKQNEAKKAGRKKRSTSKSE